MIEIDQHCRHDYHMRMPTCANCGAVYTAPVYRNTLCPSCEKELKTCRNCRHFAPGAANDCREPVSEPILEKDRANFCDWFTPAEDAWSAKTENSSKADSKAAFDRLFGDD